MGIPDKSFEAINLDKSNVRKAPKRLVYYSDGVLEEYSSDDEVDTENTAKQLSLEDFKTLPWIPYLGHMFWWMGSKSLGICDYLGENLAWFLGITSPKFQYELEQFQKMAKEEEELKKHIKAENAGWCSIDSNKQKAETVFLQPHSKSPETLIKIDKESMSSFDRKDTESEAGGKF